MKKTYAVFGLGRYGSTVAKELINHGEEVIAVDMNEELVSDYATEIPFCKCADITDPEVIKQLGISNVDIVIIAMASNLEASVMATMLCKEAGVETVIVKCANEMNCRIIEKVGADKIVFPEIESGINLARSLSRLGFIDIMTLTDDISMFEMDVLDDWAGKTPVELKLRNKYGINIVAIRRNNQVSTDIDPTKPLEKEMSLIVIADVVKFRKLK